MNLQALQNHQFPSQRFTYSAKDTALYALSVGVGSDPLDTHQLRLVYEKTLQALPTLASVIATPTPWVRNPAFDVHYAKLLHGEQTLTIHTPLPASAEVQAHYRVIAVDDKGIDKGALLHFERAISDAATSEALCTVTSSLFLRADGGCGSFGTPPASAPAAPAHAFSGTPDFTDELTTAVSSALLYRLNGDLNPLHIDPAAATAGGFDRPILHGLCTYGVAGYLLVRTACDHDPTRLRALNVRFKSPVYPGETIRLEAWHGPDGIYFQAVVPKRKQVVLSNGFARIQ